MSTLTVFNVGNAFVTHEFEKVFREHSSFVYHMAYSVTGRPEDAEDVVQTIFLRLLQRGFPPAFGANPKAYLYRAAINVSLDAVRLRRRDRQIAELQLATAPDAAQPADSLEFESDERQRLLDALAQLNPRMVEVLVSCITSTTAAMQKSQICSESRAA
jgi:RNA polymerase sigma-70 factor (ECF subfamily)